MLCITRDMQYCGIQHSIYIRINKIEEREDFGHITSPTVKLLILNQSVLQHYLFMIPSTFSEECDLVSCQL